MREYLDQIQVEVIGLRSQYDELMSYQAAGKRVGESTADFKKVLELNVGGNAELEYFRGNLCLIRDSLMFHFFAAANSHYLKTDSKGRIFIDSDPEIFSMVMQWLRVGEGDTDRASMAPLDRYLFEKDLRFWKLVN